MQRRPRRIWLLPPALLIALGCARTTDGPDGAGAPDPAMTTTSEPVDSTCAWTAPSDTLVHEGGAILQVWTLPNRPVYDRTVLPPDTGLLGYRSAVRERGAAVAHPRLVVPEDVSAEQRAVWEDERYNNRLAYAGEVGSIEPLTCLDALLFAEQNRRVPQLERPTEFLASVLVRGDGGELAVVFGAGTELFIPSSVYGFDVVDGYRGDGWRYRYAIHNHTLQRDDGDIVLGVPVPSTSDVSLARGLAERRGLDSVRVTNGLFTFSAGVHELARFRGR